MREENIENPSEENPIKKMITEDNMTMAELFLDMGNVDAARDCLLGKDLSEKHKKQVDKIIEAWDRKHKGETIH